MPTGTPTSTHTPAATPTSPPTITPVPTSVVPARPTATPKLDYPAPSLMEPAKGARIEARQHFTWQWYGPALGEDLAFDLRIWSAQEEQVGLPRRGAVAPTTDLDVEVEMRYVPAVMDYGPGDYYWTVVVVRTNSDKAPQVVGVWGEERRFILGGSSEPPRPKPTIPPSKPTPTRIQP
jgi:hypothetical protein